MPNGHKQTTVSRFMDEDLRVLAHMLPSSEFLSRRYSVEERGIEERLMEGEFCSPAVRQLFGHELKSLRSEG